MIFFKSNDVPILWTPAKYPEIETEHKTVFEELPTFTPYYVPSSSDYIDDPPINKSGSINELVKQTLLRKNKRSYIPYSSTKLPPDIGNFQLEFFYVLKYFKRFLDIKRKENPLRQIFGRIEEESKKTIDRRNETQTQQTKDSDISKSLLSHCEFGVNSIADPFSYKPEPGNLSNFDFPDDLPNLPGLFFYYS